MSSTLMSDELMEWVKHQGTPEELRKLIGLFRNLAQRCCQAIGVRAGAPGRGIAMLTWEYLARRKMRVGDRVVQPGDLVPEASSWTNIDSYLRTVTWSEAESLTRTLCLPVRSRWRWLTDE